MQAIADERFLILPHPEVLTFFQRKASDYDRWLAGMRRLQARVAAGYAAGSVGCTSPRSTATVPAMGVRLEPADEYMHELGPESNFNESMYINCFDPAQRVGGWFRIGNRANEGTPR